MSRYVQKCFLLSWFVKQFKFVVFGHFKYLKSEQQLTPYIWFLWSGALPKNCDGKDICKAIKTLEMNLERKLENLYPMLENISMSLQPPPGKLGIIDLIGSSVYRFFHPFLVTSALYELTFLQLQPLLARNCMTTGKLTVKVFSTFYWLLSYLWQSPRHLYVAGRHWKASLCG